MKVKWKMVGFIFVFLLFVSLDCQKAYCGTFYATIEEYAEANRKEIEAAGYTYVGGGSYNPISNPVQEKEKPKACDHSYESKVLTEPTCKNAGMMQFACSKCNHSYKSEIAATGKHKFECQLTREATCTESGIETFTCSVCADTYEEELGKTGHDYVSKVITNATCLVHGEQEFSCKNCADTYTEELAPLGHKESDWQVTKNPGLFFPGEKQVTCARCQEVIEETVIESKYPTYYLYVLCGVGIIVVICLTLIWKKRK